MKTQPKNRIPNSEFRNGAEPGAAPASVFGFRFLPASRLRFPLYAKILLWFFLNLLCLGLVFYGVFRAQFRLGLDSLLIGHAGDRIQAVSELIAAELDAAPAAQWDEVLERFTDAYQVHFLLFRLDGSQAAGEPTLLPPEVRAKIMTMRGPGPLAGRGPPPGRGPLGPPAPLPPPGPLPKFMVHTSPPSRYWVGVRLPLADPERHRPGPVTVLAVSHSIRGGGLFFDPTPWLAVGGGVVCFSVLFWIPLVRGLTRSISQMTRATEQIAEGRFDTRVAATRGDELGRLGQAINQMAARLKGFVTGQRRFLGDIAHELCSPIARIQVALGILEQRADGEQKEYVNDLRDDVQRMSNLVHELLSFSKASLEPTAVKLQPVDLRPLVEQAVHREAADASQVRIAVPNELQVLADPELLVRSLANLVRNAVRYAAHAGPITVSAEGAEDLVTITVADCGPGVPAASLAQLFDPFYRPEPSRSAETGGVGLGLAIVKTCIESCQGTVSCRNRMPSGLEVTLRLRSVPSVKVASNPGQTGVKP